MGGGFVTSKSCILFDLQANLKNSSKYKLNREHLSNI